MKKAQNGPCGRILEKTGADGREGDLGQEKERRGPHGAYGERQKDAAGAGRLNKGRGTPSALNEGV